MRPDEPAVLTVLHAPGHAPDMDDTVIERAEATGADVINFTEAYRIAGQPLHNRPHYWALVGRSKVDTRAVHSPMGDAGDNPILIGPALAPLTYPRPRRITTPGPGFLKFTPERWLTVRRAHHAVGGNVTIINAHPSPWFAGPRKWRRVMDAAVREVHAAKARGDAVVLTGDLQTGKAMPLLRAAGLNVFAEGVDYVAWHGLKHLSTSPFRVDRMDHPWLLSTFRWA